MRQPPGRVTATSTACATTSSTSTSPRRASSSTRRSSISSPKDTERPRYRLEIAMQWTTRLHRVGPHLREHDQHHEGGTHEEGFRTALTTLVNKYAPRQGPPQGEGRQPHRRRHPRGPDRGHLRQARPSRSSRARPRPSSATPRREAFVQKSVYDQLGDWLDRHPADAKAIINKASTQATARAGRPQGARGHPPQERRWSRPRCPASCATAPRARIRRLRDLHRRGRLRRRLGRGRVATPSTRRSCRCEARSSTSRRPVSTVPSALGTIQAIITALGTGINDEFDIASCATTRSC